MSTNNKGWIGVDLDGTLAFYDVWRGHEHIGEPIPKMADRVKAWIKEGREVRIFTARVNQPDPQLRAETVAAIKEWTLKQFGVVLGVTCSKDMEMVELWDDRATQVIPNTGVALRDLLIK